MYASFVRECIASNDRLVGLHRDTGDFAEQLARREELFTDHRSVERITICARALARDIRAARFLACAGGEYRKWPGKCECGDERRPAQPARLARHLRGGTAPAR